MNPDPDEVESEPVELGSNAPTQEKSSRRTIFIVVIALIVVGLAVRYAAGDDSGSKEGSGATVSAETDPITAAIQLVTSGKASEGARVLKEFIDKNPKNGLALYNLGTIYQIQLNDDVSAIAYYTKALDVQPKNTSALYNRGFAYWDRGDLANAAKDFEKVVELKNRKAPKALWNLGKITTLLGKPELGAKYLIEAQKLDPSLK